MYHDESPGWAFLRILFLGGMFFGAYQKGRQDTIHEIQHKTLEDEMNDLRAKLADQNRINKQVRETLGIS